MTDEQKDKKEQKLEETKRSTKRSLRVMQKARENHPIRQQSRIVKYGVKGFGRNIGLSMAATVVMMITLIILFVTMVTTVVLTNLADNTRDKVMLTVYFKPGLTEEVLENLSEVIAGDENVKYTEYATSEQEFEKYYKDNEERKKIIEVLNEETEQKTVNSFPTLVRFKVYDTEDIGSVKELIETDETIQKYIHPTIDPSYDTKKEQIEQILRFANFAKWFGVALGAIFLVISVMIILSTIRMAIFSRREEIYMEKLVGADKRFIRGPFLIEAEMSGIIAGAVAGAVCFACFAALVPWLEAQPNLDASQVINVMGSWQAVLVFLAFLLIGTLIGRIAARLAIQKYLHKM